MFPFAISNYFLDVVLIFNYVSICLCVGICTEVRMPSEAGRGVRYPGAGIIHDRELSSVGAGSWTQVF